MSDVRSEVFPATGEIQIRGGRFFMLLSTPAPVTVRFEKGGSSFGGEGVEAGYKVGPLMDPFHRVRVSGPVGGTLRYIVGDELADYARTVGVFSAQASASLQAPTADVDVGGVAGPVQLVAAGARSKVTVGLLPTATVAVRIGPQATVAANRGLRLVAGQSYTYERGEGAVYAIREAAGAALVWVLEELF